MSIRELTQYEIIEERRIDDLNSYGYLLKHIKSGARLMLLSNDDDNKVFSIGFRTPPTDSTGVAHILEHSVLCGSKKFPAKDPFIELAKGSLNTFLNAMTYPDKTVYPVASCNEKDFQNLMDVYMDAVLNPNIYIHEEIFKQEGWHYELADADSELEISGVVYNEMKGAFSSPEGVLDREILNSLFPDTTYNYESGGNPENIPDLTYADFLDFHKKYYHPVNSYIYLYGNMDMKEKLIWLDSEYLSKYEAIEINSEISSQKAFDKTIEVVKNYSISNDESEEENTYLSYNTVISDSLDKELYIAFQILEYAIMAPGAPLKKALIDANIGKDILSSYENGIKQPYFSIIAKNSDFSKKEDFIRIIKEVLSEQATNGINKKSLLAGINIYEFKYREADFGSYPKGLMYGLQSFDSWLYDENKPFIHLESNEIFDRLKSKVDEGYFENLIREYLLDNNHSSVVILKPEKGLTAQKEDELAARLAEYKAGLSPEEIKYLVDDTAALKLYQTEPSSKEAIESIPVLKREDIRTTATPFDNTVIDVDGTKLVAHNIFTNGIGYLEILFKADNVSNELLPYLGILKTALGYVDTKNYSYLDLTNEINLNSGGISDSYSVYTDSRDDNNINLYFEFKARILYDKIGFAFDIIKEIITSSDFDNTSRLKEIIDESKSRLQMFLNNSGHSVAVLRAGSYFSKVAKINEITGGIEYYQLLSRLAENFDDYKEELVSNLKRLCRIIFRPENLLISYTANDAGLSLINEQIISFKKILYTDAIETEPFTVNLVKKNEGIKTAAKIQYVARIGNYKTAGFKETGVHHVLKVILGYDYLWNNVRVKGGAYGCMSSFSRSGDAYMVSYRDPNLEKTNEVFNNTPDYLENFTADERTMTKYIIGAISSIDTPLTPSLRGSRSMVAYLTNLSFDTIQKSRDEILNCKEADIRAQAAMIQSILDQDYICVVGGENKIEENKDMFMNIISIH